MNTAFIQHRWSIWAACGVAIGVLLAIGGLRSCARLTGSSGASWGAGGVGSGVPAGAVSGVETTPDGLEAAALGSEAPSSFAGPGLERSVSSFQACMELLLRANLFDDLPAGAQLLASVKPDDGASKLEAGFEEVLSGPSGDKVSRFLELCLDEYVARQFDATRASAPDRAEATEPLRQIFLRMALAVEYSRRSGALGAGEGDRVLWDLGLKRNFEGAGELGDLFRQMIDQRLQETVEDEARWAAARPEDVQDDLSEEALSRHWVRGLINLRLEDAAREGDAGAFDRLAERFLAIPHGGSDRAFWTRYDQRTVAGLRGELERKR